MAVALYGHPCYYQRRLWLVTFASLEEVWIRAREKAAGRLLPVTPLPPPLCHRRGTLVLGRVGNFLDLRNPEVFVSPGYVSSFPVPSLQDSGGIIS